MNNNTEVHIRTFDPRENTIIIINIQRRFISEYSKQSSKLKREHS